MLLSLNFWEVSTLKEGREEKGEVRGGGGGYSG